MNVAKGRFVLGQTVKHWSAAVLRISNVVLAPFDEAIAIDAGELADGLHGDPADRVMIATARALNCPLVTADRRIIDYAARGHLSVIDARR